MNKICFGCGSVLQSEDKEKRGYIPENKKDSSYCMRCFRMIHYGEIKDVSTPKEKKEIIRKVNNDKKFVIFLVDFLNISDEVIDIYKKIKKKKILLINKCELMPKEVYKEKFKNYIKDYYKLDGDIKLKGGNKSHGAPSIYRYLKEKKINEAYILGISNSGKSTLINDLSDYLDSKVVRLTINNKANTTLDFIRVKISNDLTLIDSPGFILDNMLDSKVNGNKIKAYTFNMKECETIGLINNKYFIKFDKATPITFYTNTENKNPIKKYYKAAPDLKYIIDVDDNMDIVLKGIGFIRIKNKCSITTNINKKYLEIRKSMFS